MAMVSASCTAMARFDVLAVLEVKQRPNLRISAKNHMATASSISAIGPAFGRGPVAVHVGTARPSFARTATEFDVVNKILVGHESGQ